MGAYKLAQYLIGEDGELLCLLAAIPLFIGSYAILILLLHGIKQCIYAYFKRNIKELNNRVERENMDNYIVKHLEEIQKKLENVLRYTRLVLLLHGFSDEDLYQIAD